MKTAVMSVLIVSLILSAGADGFAATWFVRSDVAESGDGTSWEGAFAGVAEAVAAASAGDDVWVQAGRYLPSSTIYLSKAIAVLGGFTGNETDADQRNFAANETILDGGGAIRILQVSASATLDGLTITNGSANRAGAMWISGGSPIFQNCMITHNQSTESDTSSVGYNGGGAAYVLFATPTFNNCVFAHNTALAFGGAVNAYNGSARFINCTFTRNIAYSGGAFYIQGYTGTKHALYNCIFWGNTGGSRPDVEVKYASTDGPEGSNNCCAGYYLGDAQVYTDPLLIDPDNGNYHIGPGSSCIDQGTSSTTLLAVDVDGDARQLDGDANGSAVVDIGADEYDPSQVFFADFYVDGLDGDDGNDGTTWATAKASLQAAIDAATENDEIWVRSHTYGLSAEVDVDKILFVYGGFAGTEIQRDSRDWVARPTVIDGQDTVRCMNMNAAATVDGFTFTHGSAVNGGAILVSADGATVANSSIQNSSATGSGGGVYCSRTTNLNGCTILNNTAGENGGGIYTISSNSTTISDCLISGNTTSRSTDGGGGGIYNDAGFSPLITGCTIRGNITAGHGGGIHNNERNDARISGCTIILNSASKNGGGIYSGQNSSINYARPEITNCVIANNHAASGGGLYSDEASDTDMINCTIAGNTASSHGAGLYLAYRNSYAAVMNSIFMGNVLDGGGYSDIEFVYYDGIAGSSFNNLKLLYNNFSMLDASWHNAGAPQKIGNMAVSPDFTDYNGPDGDPLAGGDSDYHLSPESGLLDVGIESYATYSLTAPCDDLEGNERPQGMGYDLGAYETLISTPTYTLTATVFGGFGTVTPTGGTYYDGTEVLLTAEPDDGYQVAAWSGTSDDNSTATTNTVVMNGPKTVTVSFEGIPATTYDLTATVSGGNGTVSPASGTYDEGETVTLTATPDTGYHVMSWSGTDDDNSTATTNTVVMDSNQTVTVLFSCTDPDDADTDDDGIADAIEDANQNGTVDAGETDPCNADTDGDGLQDGTEAGYTLADITDDTDTGVFQADLDPLTTTDPLDDDSDSDGWLDGQEDTNHNGRVDSEETDPGVSDASGRKAMPWVPLLLLED
ncbi:hypothetical protein DSCA_27580 [Desulfosarcina alkanivorans]|uniref:Bacterial repeat domain-containing protein n=1 Tax=Desulfosarcina alkanivorans TaxID=571177 RepID=A0A5K7YIS4_9BACT|nr:choice-of-anchor Q domain-containing protein [Desulfosarcina alkanivorans]BBO68828.1 hypothetical protein DSCA_27580 [Desulfosarcina alkanivorans]